MDAQGQPVGRFEAPSGYTWGRIHVSDPDRDTLLTLGLTGEYDSTLMLLDRELKPVWTIPFPWAFGAGSDQNGGLLFLGTAMLKLYPSESYQATREGTSTCLPKAHKAN